MGLTDYICEREADAFPGGSKTASTIGCGTFEGESVELKQSLRAAVSPEIR